MEWVVLGFAAVVPILLGVAFRLGRALSRPSARRSLLSPVTQQHLHLFQGGRLSESAVETAKAQLRSLLERGAVEEAEASLQPGLGYAVQVQALAELDSAQAGTILQRQLGRRISDDPVEQSWYWLDLAHGLRALNRSDSVPHLLLCPASGADQPLGQFYAAETVCCGGFASYLVRPSSPLGQAALRVLHQALRGLRYGVQPQIVAEGRLGEVVARLWRCRPAHPDPIVVRVFVEALRLWQRADHVGRALADSPFGGDALHRQIAELLTLHDALTDYLDDASSLLGESLAAATDANRTDLLLALDDLRADVASVVLPRMRLWPAGDRVLAVRLLRYACGSDVGPALMTWTRQWVQPERRARRASHAFPPPRPSVPEPLPYGELLRSLRGHPAPDVEAFLVCAARDWDPTYRAAAAGGLGWWDPFLWTEVQSCLHKLTEDENVEVRLSALAALARLGERRALQFFRQTLVSETDSEAAVPEAVRRVAAEGLTWLWPDLDCLADADDLEVSQTAREALEQLREELTGGLGHG